MTIPVIGDACVAIPAVIDEPSPATLLSSAMMAKVGDAARLSASAALSALLR